MIGIGYKVNNKQGVSLILTGISVLSFFYISFLGLGYILEGLLDSDELPSLSLSFLPEIDTLLIMYVVISIFYLFLLSAMLYVLCSSKSNRNKRIGLPIEIFSSIIIVILLVLGCFPFMKFLYIIEQEELLLNEVAQMRKSALDIDADYMTYVEKRVERFFEYGGKSYGKFSSSTAKSLKKRLIPLNYEKMKSERLAWLNEMHEVSVWNPCTAHNIKAIMKASETWTKEYSKLSSFCYQHESTGEGESYPHFEHKVSELNRNKWIENFRKSEVPDGRVLGALVITLIFIFSLYMSINRPLNTIIGTHKNT